MYTKTCRQLIIVCVTIAALGCSQSNDGQVTAVAATLGPTAEVANEDAAPDKQEEGGATTVKEIEWDVLIPDEWRPDKWRRNAGGGDD